MGIIKTNHPLSVKSYLKFGWGITKIFIVCERHATHSNKEKNVLRADLIYLDS